MGIIECKHGWDGCPECDTPANRAAPLEECPSMGMFDPENVPRWKSWDATSHDMVTARDYDCLLELYRAGAKPVCKVCKGIGVVRFRSPGAGSEEVGQCPNCLSNPR